MTMLAALLLTAPLADPVPFLTVTRGVNGPGETQLEIGVLRAERGNHYWLRRVNRKAGRTSVNWTDTHRCAAARDVVQAASGLEPPRVEIPGIPVTPDGSITLTLDGVQYSFESGAHYDGNGSSRIRFTSNVGTPLARFVESSLEALEACWSDEAPDALFN